MRALANYVMKGRTEAVITAVLTTGSVLFAWVGAAVIALVTLRKGPGQGSKVLVWAMLPAVALAAVGDTGPVTTLLGVAFAATVLRGTTSWQWALTAAVFSGLVTALLMSTLGKLYVEQLLQLLSEMLATIAAQQDIDASKLFMPKASHVTGLLGLSNTLTVIICLMLARWWQAILYNPGGFQAEFHSLRLAKPLAAGLLVATLAGWTLSSDYRLWALIFVMPYVFAGFGLIHGLAAKKGLGSQWLGVFYFFWLLLEPVKILVIILAVADSWLDLRSRVATNSGTK